MFYLDPLSMWLYFKNPRLYISLLVLLALGYFGFHAWKHYFPPVVHNEPLTEAVERFVNSNLGSEDFFIEGDSKDLQVSQVWVIEQRESGYAPNEGTILVGIKGNYNLVLEGKEPKLKTFNVKHRMDYEKIDNTYTIKYKRLPHIKYL